MLKNVSVPRRRFVASSLSAAAMIADPLHGLSARPNHPAVNEPTAELTPYLLFDGTCAEAMHFYHSVFGGELNLVKVKDSVMKDHLAPSLQDLVLNARLQSASIDLSASDWLRPDRTRVRGNTVCLYLRCDTHHRLRQLFDQLSMGAEVTDPLTMRPFGAYGALNDKFSVRWMFWTGEKRR